MKSKDLFKAMEEPEIPEKPSVTIHLDRGSDEDIIWLSQCVNPLFDMAIIGEGLATAIVVAAKYDARPLPQLLEEVINRLRESVTFHGTIKRQE